MATKQKTTLTQGSVARGMLLFGLPIFISNLFQQPVPATAVEFIHSATGGLSLLIKDVLV